MAGHSTVDRDGVLSYPRSRGLTPTAADINRSHDNYCAKVIRLVAVSLLGVFLAYLVFCFAIVPYEELLEGKSVLDRQRDVLQRNVAELEQKLSSSEPLYCDTEITDSDVAELDRTLPSI